MKFKNHVHHSFDGCYDEILRVSCEYDGTADQHDGHEHGGDDAVHGLRLQKVVLVESALRQVHDIVKRVVAGLSDLELHRRAKGHQISPINWNISKG